MKKYVLSLFSILFLLTACKDYKPEVDRLNKERDSLITSAVRKDSTIDVFLGDFNSIESSLDSVNQLHMAITMDAKSDPEMGGTVKDRIRRNIENINNLLNENSKRIAKLSSRVKGSKVKLAQLERMISELNINVAEKDSMIANLNLQLNDANISITSLKSSIDTLNTVIAAKSQVIDEKTNIINTAYYTMGSYKQLRDKQLISKEGGFLGMGRNQVLKSDLDASQFTKIDITQTSKIPLEAKDIKIITNHPSGSYQIDKANKKVSGINITDATKFWSSSKYLVIVTK